MAVSVQSGGLRRKSTVLEARKPPPSLRQANLDRSGASAINSPFHNRERLREKYEKPVSDRETWWRYEIKETPNPGHYESGDYLLEMNKRPASYNFRSNGRLHEALPFIGNGAVLLPGAYEYQDLAKRLDNYSKLSYGFKNCDRQSSHVVNASSDRNIDIEPGQYNIEKYESIGTDNAPTKTWTFKSRIQRFPTIYFKPKEGPAPGYYNSADPSLVNRAVSSSFKSKTPRFRSSHTKIPGPGTYERTFQSPMPAPIADMGRVHGIFFSNDFRL